MPAVIYGSDEFVTGAERIGMRRVDGYRGEPRWISSYSRVLECSIDSDLSRVACLQALVNRESGCRSWC